MHTHRIIGMMNPMEHCPSCGALLVTVPGGTVCPHCGFELEEPDGATVLAFRKAVERNRNGTWAADAWPEDVFDEVA